MTGPGRSASRRTAEMRVELVDASSGYPALEAEWHRLAGIVPGCVWSSLPGVFRVWQQVLRGGAATKIISMRDREGALYGVMPILRERVWRGPSGVPRYDYARADRGFSASRRPRPLPLRQITTVGSVPGTLLWVGPLVRPGVEDAAFDALADCIGGMKAWDVLVIPSFEGAQQARWLASLKRAGLRPWVHPLGRVVQNLRVLRPFDEIVAEQNGKYRQNVRRARVAASTSGLRFSIHAGATEVAPVLAEVARIARASWKHEGRPGQDVRLPYEGAQRAFFERLLVSDDLGATPVVACASGPEGPVAVLLGIEHFRTFSALLTFMDGQLAAASPGLLLFGAVIDWAAARGLRHFHFNATHGWVRHLVDDRQTVCNVVAFAPTLAGRTFGLISRTAQRLK